MLLRLQMLCMYLLDCVENMDVNLVIEWNFLNCENYHILKIECKVEHKVNVIEGMELIININFCPCNSQCVLIVT